MLPATTTTTTTTTIIYTMGKFRFNRVTGSFGEGFFPHILGGITGWPYYRFLSSPFPALPPYMVRTKHIHGTRTTEDTTQDFSENIIGYTYLLL